MKGRRDLSLTPTQRRTTEFSIDGERGSRQEPISEEKKEENKIVRLLLFDDGIDTT